jgi:hypothetical protein
LGASLTIWVHAPLRAGNSSLLPRIFISIISVLVVMSFCLLQATLCRRYVRFHGAQACASKADVLAAAVAAAVAMAVQAVAELVLHGLLQAWHAVPYA